MQRSENGFAWDVTSEAYAEGKDGKPNKYSALTEYQQWVDWLHGRIERDEVRRVARGR